MSGKIKHLQMYKGNFRVRMGVPAKCRPHLIPPHAGKSELVRGLGTANQTLAGKLAAPLIAEFHAIIEQARREAVPMEWQHYWVPPQPYNGFGGARLGRTQVPVGTQIDFMNHHKQLGYAPVAPLRSQGQALPVPVAPSPQALGSQSHAAMMLASLSFAAIIELWADEKQVPRKRKVATLGLFAKLAKFLGHDQAGRVTGEDLVSFKEGLLQAVKRAEIGQPTIQTYVEILRTVFRFAFTNRKIASNPADGLTFTAKADPRNERQDFSADDMRLILTEASEARNAAIKWSNWIAAFSGARLAEIVEANTADFETIGDSLVFHIRLDNREDGQTLKSDQSTRRFPLHSAIIKEGFADYLRSLPVGSPLFPKVKRDSDGKRGTNAGNTIMRWLRQIGITDRRKVFHSHRHTFKTACRGKIDREIRNYITGHSSGDVAADYGEYPIPMLAELIEKIASPLADSEVVKLAAQIRVWRKASGGADAIGI